MQTKTVFISFVIVALTSPVVMAKNAALITEEAKIEALLKSIPYSGGFASYKTLSERLSYLGLSATSVVVGPLAPDEIEYSNGLYKKGDVIYSFTTSKPNKIVTDMCPILSMLQW